MSYILDALRRADTERARGTVPGIHAQPTFTGASTAGMRRAAGPALWVAGGAALLLVAAGLGSRFGGSTGGAAAPAAQAPVALPAAPLPAPPAPPAAIPAPAPSPMVVDPAAVARTPEPATPTPASTTLARKPKPAGPVPPKRPSAEPAAQLETADGSPPEVKPGAAPDTRVYALNELPDEIRRQLPVITVGGSMYSATKADRILIINGQVLHEGDPITPDLVLQQIKLKAAVLAFKGYRYGITY